MNCQCKIVSLCLLAVVAARADHYEITSVSGSGGTVYDSGAGP
jgi:hypothetical protein